MYTNKSYLTLGYILEMSMKWTSTWSNEAKILYFKNIISNPLKYLKIIFKQAGYYSLKGPLFFYDTLWDKESNHWTKFEPLLTSSMANIKIPFIPLFSIIIILFSAIVFVLYIFLCFYTLNPLLSINKFKNMEKKNKYIFYLFLVN